MVAPGEDRGKHRPFRGGRRGGSRGKNQRGNSSKRSEKSSNEESEKNNPFFVQFKNHAAFLDRRHDKRERLVKLSRDITIESKRIIFLLHRIKQLPKEDKEEAEDNDQASSDQDICIDKGNEEEDKILNEAEDRLKVLETDTWRQVATELVNEDPFMYLRSYTGGTSYTKYFEVVFQCCGPSISSCSPAKKRGGAK